MLFLRWYLWIAPYVVLGICLLVFCRRRLYQQFPIFAGYASFQLLGFLITLVAALLIPHAVISLRVYRWIVVGDMSIDDVLELAALYELSDHLVFRRSQMASELRPFVRWAVAALIVVAVGSSALFAQTGRERVVLAVQVLEYSSSLVSIGLILALLLLTRALRISWSSLPAGIALGFSVNACAELSSAALISALNIIGWVRIDLIGMAAFHITALLWLLYLFLPSKPPRFTGHRPDRTELEGWNQELQKIVR